MIAGSQELHKQLGVLCLVTIIIVDQMDLVSGLADCCCPETLDAVVGAGDNEHFQKCRRMATEQIFTGCLELIVGDDKSLVEGPAFES